MGSDYLMGTERFSGVMKNLEARERWWLYCIGNALNVTESYSSKWLHECPLAKKYLGGMNHENIGSDAFCEVGRGQRLGCLSVFWLKYTPGRRWCH